MATQVKVALTGAAGTRTTEVNPPDSESRERAWSRISKSMAVDTTSFPITPNPTPPAPLTPEPSPLPTIDEVFTAFLPQHIEKTRWGRYIVPGLDSRVWDSAIFVYQDPCESFWSLETLATGIFKDLGIRLSKTGGVWDARIPIPILTDDVFVESGLASVEKTLLAGTSIDPSSDDSPKSRTVRDIEIERGIKRLNERVEAENAYCKRNDVEAKRAVAMRLYEERVKPQANSDACVTGDPQQILADNETSWINDLGEKYGMEFSDIASLTDPSDHLDADALIRENGDWIENCSWAFPTDSFWVAWRKAKNALKATGYETIKLDGIWLVYVWR